MTLKQVIFAVLFSTPMTFTRKSWPKGMHVSINKATQSMIFHRHADSVITWRWMPTPEEILGEDYLPYRPNLEAFFLSSQR